MTVVHIDEKSIRGIAVRTNNTNEMEPDSARLGKLWQRFYEDVFPQAKEGAVVFAVYYDYESDATGDYSVLAGVAQDALASQENRTDITIQAGDYLIFTGQGELPQAVVQTWAKIWDYFSQIDVPHQRAYTTDFEHYKSADEIEIYIAIR